MPLFNPKTLNRYLKNDAQIPTDHFSLLGNWADLIRSNQIYRLKEGGEQTRFHNTDKQLL